MWRVLLSRDINAAINDDLLETSEQGMPSLANHIPDY
jgi:hypothetical protein